MKTYFIKNDNTVRKISNAEAIRMVGVERFKKMVSEGKEIYEDDPATCIQYMVSGGRLGFEF